MTNPVPSPVTIHDLQVANRDYRDTQADLIATRDRFHATIAAAIDRDHIPHENVARAVGLSKSRVFDILAAHYARAAS